MLAYQLERIALRDRRSRDFTQSCSAARPARGDRVVPGLPLATSPRAHVSRAGPAARRSRRPLGDAPQPGDQPVDLSLPPRTFCSTGSTTPEDMPEDEPGPADFAGKFQQVTAPVMAKGLEDTTFYVYNRLVSLNEVGGEPVRFGSTAEAAPSLEHRASRAGFPTRSHAALNPRHQAERGRPGPDQRAVRDSRRWFAGRRALVAS